MARGSVEVSPRDDASLDWVNGHSPFFAAPLRELVVAYESEGICERTMPMIAVQLERRLNVLAEFLSECPLPSFRVRAMAWRDIVIRRELVEI
jgi:hypothetical protein